MVVDIGRHPKRRTAAALVTARSLRAVTMSQIAAATGIGRATLYKYFPDIETILVTWHDRDVAGHLHHLTEVRESTRAPGERLEAVFRAYAQIVHERPHGSELATLVHRPEPWPKRTGNFATSSGRCSHRQPLAAACMPSPPPAASRPRRRSAASSR